MAITPRTANGWASVNRLTTGGTGGIEIEFTDFVQMWIWLRNNLTTPAIVTYKGLDFDRTGFPATFPNSTFSNTSRFEVQGLKNKTIRASQGQKLTMCNVRFRNNQNIIWENWSHFDSLDDLVGIQNDSENVWVRHCNFDANEFNTNGTADGSLDVTTKSNYNAITDCVFINANKTMLISGGSTAEEDRAGKLKTTVARNKFFNCIQRIPSCSYSQVGFHHNIVDTSQIPYMSGGSKTIQIGVDSQVYSYRNDFRRGRWLYEYNSTNETESGGLFENGSKIGVFESRTTPIAPEKVVWSPLTEPNYTIDDWTVDEAVGWIDQWAGAKMHLMGDYEEVIPEPTPKPTPEPQPEPQLEPEPQPTPEPDPQPQPNPKPENHPSNQKGNNGKGKKK